MSEAVGGGSDDPRPLRAVLDSDIIFSRVLHELLGRLALAYYYFELYWSEELLDEAERVLNENKKPPIAPERAAQWVNFLRQAFPNNRVEISELPDTVDLEQLTDDPDDHHVCALAVCAEADYLFSHDTKFNKCGLATYGIELTRPDDFLLAVFNDDPETIVSAVKAQLDSWSGGTKTLQDLLEAYHRADASHFAEAVATHLGITLDPSKPVDR